MIEDEPLDLLGPTHQRLVMHCLSEVSDELPIRTNLEQRLSKWLLFECEFSQSAHLASEVEFPEQALNTALLEETADIRRTILQSLAKRATIPPNTIGRAASWLEDENASVRPAAVHTLSRRSDLPEETLKAVAARLEDEDSDVREAAVEALRERSDLPEDMLKAVAARLKDKEPRIRWAANAALLRHEKYYLTLLKGAYATYLYKVLLQRSFEEQSSWYTEDGNFCFNVQEDIKRMSLDTHHDVTAMINKARPTNFPSTNGR
ncbi:hypothetical protein B0J13DRAFT_574779 [Dactylonectria estremocensis]|uniref:HEAT repeat domain-containing protein n=1 Tax=Dactylonectria estremocensis TaxID=1079267 RepID=A0A9P9I9V8_9HYPO|nr:hypothetical protein B0J13DRAFT_574779 [Dactylonectria estremocensis]